MPAPCERRPPTNSRVSAVLVALALLATMVSLVARVDDTAAQAPGADPAQPTPTATPLPGLPADPEIDRVLWRLDPYPGARDAFSCEDTDDAEIVETLLLADFACTWVGNPNAFSIPAVNVFDPDFMPSFVTVPDDAPLLLANDAVVLQRELREEVSWTSSRPIAASPFDYQQAVRNLIDLGVTQPGATPTDPAWDDFDLLPLSDPDLTVNGPVLFEDQLAKWQVLGIDDYDLRFDVRCYCPNVEDVVEVRVIDGAVVSASAADGSLPTLYSDLTVDEMFTRLVAARNAPGAATSSGVLDALYGFPRAWYLDPDAQISDDELYVRVEKFEPLLDCAGTWRAVDPFAHTDINTVCEFNTAEWSRFMAAGGNPTTYTQALQSLVDFGVAKPDALDGRIDPPWNDIYGSAGDPRFEAKFENALEKWARLSIANYELTFDIRCYCPNVEDLVTVRVINGEVASATAADGELPELFADRTIDDIFARLTAAQAPPGAASLAGSLDVLYGIPREFQLDPDAQISDDELFFTVKTFDPLIECNGDFRSFDPYNPDAFDIEAECNGNVSVDAALIGDVNCTGYVDIVDALFIVLYEVAVAVGLSVCPSPGEQAIHTSPGDVNGDGSVNVIDALVIVQCTVGVPNPYCDALVLSEG